MKSAAKAMVLALVALGASAPSQARASECDRPGAAWLMCEDFEGGDQGWDGWFAESSWAECDGCPGGTNDPNRIRLDDGQAHDGSWSLHMPGAEGAGFQGGTLRYADCVGAPQSGCELIGHERLYFRTWVRLAADHDYVHHFVGIRGTKPDRYWDAHGVAGCRPAGDRWAGTRVDVSTDHELFFYTYYPDMGCDSGGYCSGDYAQGICDGCAQLDMPCSNGLECCWGNHFSPDVPVVLPTETWTCLEMSMELNTPGQADGSMTYWVDDELGHHAEGLRFRDGPELQLNQAWLEHYIAPGDTDHPNQVWFDDVVVSTERIGCAAVVGGGTSGGAGETSGGGAESGGEDPGTGDGGSPTPTSSTSGQEPPSGSEGGSSGVGQTSGSASEAGQASGCSTSGRRGAPWLLLLVVCGLAGTRRRRPHDGSLVSRCDT